MNWSHIVLEANLSFQDALRVFNISNVPDMITLKKMYQQLAIKNHPDRGGNVEKMKEINTAYELLKKQHSTSSTGKKDFDGMSDQERSDKWKRAAYIVKSVIESTFDIQKFVSYFEEVFNQKFTVKSTLYNPEKDYYNQYVHNRYEFSSQDNEIVLYLYINSSTGELYNKVLLPGDEGLINMIIITEIVLNRRKIKLTNKNYSLKTDKRTLTDPEVLFPRKKIEVKKESSKQQKVTRKDFEITFERTLKGKKNGDFFHIPFNDNQNSVSISRGVFLRAGYWYIHDITSDTFKEKYNLTSRKSLNLLDKSVVTIFENPESLDFMTDMFKHVQNNIKSPEEAAKYINQKLREYKQNES
jgi:curved DNA-binding protein CbpA